MHDDPGERAAAHHCNFRLSRHRAPSKTGQQGQSSTTLPKRRPRCTTERRLILEEADAHPRLEDWPHQKDEEQGQQHGGSRSTEHEQPTATQSLRESQG